MSEEKILIKLLMKNKVFIMACILLFGLLSIILTRYIPKEYRSTAIVYPTRTNSLDESYQHPEFGYEIHADRLIQVFESQIIQDSLVNKFDLISYYELDTLSSDWREQLNRSMVEDFQFTRSRYMSVVLSVKTKSAYMSADACNYLLEIINSVRENILKENNRDAILLYEKKYNTQIRLVDSLLNLIYEAPEMANSKKEDLLLTRRKATINDQNNKGNYTEIDEVVKSIPLSDKELEKTINNYYYERGRLHYFKDQYRKSLDKMETPIPKIYVVSKAVVNNKKVAPSYLTNLLMGVGFGLMLSVLLILVRHKMSELKA